MVLENIVVETGDEIKKINVKTTVHRYWPKKKSKKGTTLFFSPKLVLTQVSPSVLESFSLSFGTCIH
jgi:hypothetical protein